MNETRVFDRGMAAGMLLMLGAQAIHWFISPSAHDASTLRTAGVALQAVVAFAGAAWLAYQQRRVRAISHA